MCHPRASFARLDPTVDGGRMKTDDEVARYARKDSADTALCAVIASASEAIHGNRKNGLLRRIRSSQRRRVICTHTSAIHSPYAPLDVVPAKAGRRAQFPHTSAISPRDARVLPLVKPSETQRAWGMPGARCTRSLAWEKLNHTSVVTVGSPDSPGIPARNGFNGFLRALPGDRALLSPSSAGHFPPT